MVKTPQLVSKELLDRHPQFDSNIYPELFEAIKSENLIVFLGAGVSKLLGCPLWGELASEVARKIANYAEFDILEKQASIEPRKVISICCSIAKKDPAKYSIYKKTIRRSLRIRDKEKANSLYREVFKLGAKAYLTTNIDLGILEAKPKAKRIEIFDCTSANDLQRVASDDYDSLRDENIILLHGTVKKIEKAILSVDTYLDHYEDEKVVNLLNKIFKQGNNIILFIGYSLSEWEIIERIYRLTKKNQSSGKRKVGYVLTPLFSHEYTKYQLDKEYLNIFDVEPIPYFVDYDGFWKLQGILEKLSKAADKHRLSPVEIYGKIRDIGKDANQS